MSPVVSFALLAADAPPFPVGADRRPRRRGYPAGEKMSTFLDLVCAYFGSAAGPAPCDARDRACDARDLDARGVYDGCSGCASQSMCVSRAAAHNAALRDDGRRS